jgi:hypothetical protein
MTYAIARAFGALVVILLAHSVANAQPAPIDSNCTQWRAVNQTALNPFGRECTQWTRASEAKAKKPNPERKGKRKKTSKPRR